MKTKIKIFATTLSLIGLSFIIGCAEVEPTAPDITNGQEALTRATGDIIGDSHVGMGVNATFNYPPQLSGVNFSSWILDPTSGWTLTSGSLTSQTLNIKFTTAGTYTIQANFTQGSGGSTPLTKTIVVGPTPPPPAPTIALASGGTSIAVNYQSMVDVMAVTPNSVDWYDYYFQWKSSSRGVYAEGNGVGYYPYSNYPNGPGSTVTIQCRISDDGIFWSNWSNSVSISYR